MAYRILSAAAFACLALAGSAAADTLDLVYPECRNTPIGKMTRGLIEKCDAAERMLGGVEDSFRKLKALQEPHTPSEDECLAAHRSGAKLAGCVYVWQGGELREIQIFPPTRAK